MIKLCTGDHKPLPFPLDADWGFREIRLTDSKRLRLYFLSLLWRAAETERWEFNEIELEGKALSTLRRMVRAGDPNPQNLFPIELMQLSSRGFPHNHSPIADEKLVPSLHDGIPEKVPIFRFHFDGLAIHFDRRQLDLEEFAKRGNLYVGAADDVKVATVPFEQSFQRENLIQIMVGELLSSAKLIPSAQ
jgi:hypothetical protein